MCADISRLSETLAAFEKHGIEYLHIDIMDGHFVPNFTLGTDYCARLKKLTAIPLDIHLMIEKPEEKTEWFEFGENDIVSVHAESTENLPKALAGIKSRGARTFAALNPETELTALNGVIDTLDDILIMTVNPGHAGQKMIPSCIDKIKRLRSYLDENGFSDTEIEVDGNVSFENSVIMKKAGANIFVAGSSGVFQKDLTLEDGIIRFRNGLTD